MKTTTILLTLLTAASALAGGFGFNVTAVPAAKTEHVHSNIVSIQPGKDAVLTIVNTAPATVNLFILGRAPSENRLYEIKNLVTGTNTITVPAAEFTACEGFALAASTAPLISVTGTWK